MALDRVFLDTSALYAFYDKSDGEHVSVLSVLKSRSEEFTTSNYIIDELITLLRARKFHIRQISSFIEDFWSEKICRLLRVTEDVEMEAWDLLKKNEDQDFSFTDCTSFVLMRKNNIVRVCTLDRHFSIAGFESIPG